MSIILDNLNFLVFFMSALLVCLFLMLFSFFLGEKTFSRSKHIQFESGISSINDNKNFFLVHFYQISIFFILFDVESLYLYTWILSIKESGWFGFMQASFLIFFLLIEILYIFRMKFFSFIKNN